MATPEEIEKLKAQLEDARRIAEAQGDDKRIERLKKERAIIREILNDQKDLVELTTAANAEQVIKTKEAEKAQAQLDLDTASNQAARRVAQQQLEAVTEELEKQQALLRDTRDALKDTATVLEKNNLSYQDAVDKSDKLKNALNRNRDIIEKSENPTRSILDNFEGSRGVIGGLIQDAGRFKRSLRDASLNMLSSNSKFLQGFGRVGAGVAQASTAALAGAGAIGLLIIKAGKLALEFDNLSKEIGKSTGFGNKFGDTIKDVGRETLLAGVGFKEAADALGTLSKELSAFDPNAKKVNVETTKTVALMSQIGVSASTSVSSINLMNRQMGLSVEVATEMTAQLAMMGKEIGIVSEKMVKDFVSAQDRLAVYGNNSIRVFKEMAAMAKAAGMEISTLTKVSEQFDTFDKAAETAAKLNAHLGTNIDMMRMMHADEAEIVKEIQRQTKARVGNMNSLDKHTQRLVANALNLGSVAEAQKFLNMNMAEAQKYSSGMQEQADIQAELSKRAAELVPVMKKLGLVFLKLILLLEPVISLFEVMIDVVNSLGTSAGGVGESLSSLDEPLLFGITTLDLIKTGLTGLAIAAGAAALGLGAVSAPVLGVVVALAGLFAMLHKRGSPEFYELPRYFAEGFDILGNSLSNVSGFLGAGSKGVTGMLDGLWSIWHKPGSDMLYELPRYFAEGFTMIADSITTTIDSLSNFISLVTEFAKIDFDGFIAVSSEGGATSMVMGSSGVLKQMSEGKLTVDVNMPQIVMPPIEINVIFNDTKFEKIIDAKINKRLGK